MQHKKQLLQLLQNNNNHPRLVYISLRSWQLEHLRHSTKDVYEYVDKYILSSMFDLKFSASMIRSHKEFTRSNRPMSLRKMLNSCET